MIIHFIENIQAYRKKSESSSGYILNSKNIKQPKCQTEKGPATKYSCSTIQYGSENKWIELQPST